MSTQKPAQPPPTDRKWRNRIVAHGEEDPAKLLAHPKNWRLHPENQKSALTGVLADVGWVQDVIVNQRSGFLVDGHARVQLALDAGEKVPVVYVDLSEDEEAKVLASLDPLGAMALTDEALLGSLVSDLDLGSESLDAFLGSLVDKAGQMQLKPEGGASPADDPSDGRHKLQQNRRAQVKAVLFVDQVKVVERALRATGEQNRGAALVQICEAFLKAVDGGLGELCKEITAHST